MCNGVTFWYSKVEIWIVVWFSTLVENNFPGRCLTRASCFHIDITCNLSNRNTSSNISSSWCLFIPLSSLSRIKESSFFVDIRLRVIGSRISFRYHISNCCGIKVLISIFRCYFSETNSPCHLLTIQGTTFSICSTLNRIRNRSFSCSGLLDNCCKVSIWIFKSFFDSCYGIVDLSNCCIGIWKADRLS